MRALGITAYEPELFESMVGDERVYFGNRGNSRSGNSKQTVGWSLQRDTSSTQIMHLLLRICNSVWKEVVCVQISSMKKQQRNWLQVGVTL